jgi:lactoylglutathione lyase
MVRVVDLDRSTDFYRTILGMQELSRANYVEERFTLVFLGYESDQSNPVIELTYNWDVHDYHMGTGFGHIAVEVEDIHACCRRCRELGVKIIREPGPMHYSPQESDEREVIAFIEDPDGYKIELIAV